MAPKLKRRLIEDPNNTWNQQLMQACLNYNISEAETLVTNGADPIKAREMVPFYLTPISPLIALLLQGKSTEESWAMMNWLLQQGANPFEQIILNGKNLITSPEEEGNILHLLVQLGQPGLLLEVLALVGPVRPPPISLLKRFPKVETAPTTPATTGNHNNNNNNNNNNNTGSVSPARPTSSKRTGRLSRVTPPDSSATSGVYTNILDGKQPKFTPRLQYNGEIDFDARTSEHHWTVMDLAIQRGDSVTIQILLYYGAPGIFHKLVNGSQTALARACAMGDRELVEVLLDAGDNIHQISLDGRYTLIHYAAAQPAILDILLSRGLHIDVENNLGESALISLICYGQGRNAENSIRDTPRPADAAKLATLPTATLRNYILTPVPPLIGGPGGSSSGPSKLSKTSIGVNSMNAMEMVYTNPTHDADSWFYFTMNSNTWTMIQNLCERGADVHGDIPRSEEDKTVQRSDDNRRRANSSSINYSLHHHHHHHQQHHNHNNNQQQSRQRSIASSGSPWPSDEQSDSFGNPFTSTANTNTMAGTWQLNHNNEIIIDDRNDNNDNEYDIRPSLHQLTRLTPLMHAIIAYHPELIRRLAIEYRADPMVQDAKGACALHYAALARHPSVMELFLSSLVAPLIPNFDINIQDCCGRTPLHYAAAHGNIRVVQTLLSIGPILHAGRVDFAGRTPLHLAVLAKESEIVQLLLQHAEAAAAAADSASSASAISTRRKGGGSSSNNNNNNNTTISGRRKIRQSSSSGVSETLTAEQAALACVPGVGIIDIEAEELIMGRTAIEMAVMDIKDANIVRLLLTVGYASLRHGSGLETGGTLLHRTVSDGSVEIMRLLLENYADPNDFDDFEQTPLHLAVQSKLPQAVEIVRELLRFGATPEIQSGITLETPIIIAARRGEFEMLDLLLHQPQELGYGHLTGSSYPSRTTTTTNTNITNTRERLRNISRSRTGTPSSPSRRSVKQQSQLQQSQQTQTQSKRSGKDQKQQQQQQQQQQQEQRKASASSTGSGVNENSMKDENNNNNNSSSCDSRQTPFPYSATIAGGNASNNLAAVAAAAVNASLSPRESEIIISDRPLLSPHHLLITDGKVRTALHYLCSHREKEKQIQLFPLIREILQCILTPTLLSQIDSFGRIPLHDACAAGYSLAVQEILLHDDGSFCFMFDAHGCLPLHYAVISNDSTSIISLIQSLKVWLPCTLRGVTSAVANDAIIPITTRILQEKEKQNKHFTHDRVLHPLKVEGKRVMWIDSVWSYLNIHDGLGRTPLIIAAELGNREASKTLIQLLQQHKKNINDSASVRTATLRSQESLNNGNNNNNNENVMTAPVN